MVSGHLGKGTAWLKALFLSSVKGFCSEASYLHSASE